MSSCRLGSPVPAAGRTRTAGAWWWCLGDLEQPSHCGLNTIKILCGPLLNPEIKTVVLKSKNKILSGEQLSPSEGSQRLWDQCRSTERNHSALAGCPCTSVDVLRPVGCPTPRCADVKVHSSVIELEQSTENVLTWYFCRETHHERDPRCLLIEAMSVGHS